MFETYDICNSMGLVIRTVNVSNVVTDGVTGTTIMYDGSQIEAIVPREFLVVTSIE
jgi:hypothetical protein